MFAQALAKLESIEYKFCPEEEKLIDQAKDEDPLYSMMAKYNMCTVRDKLTILVDIYGGYYPKIFVKDDALCNQYATKLVEHCKIHNKRYPSTKVNNKILQDAIIAEELELEEKRNQKAIKVQLNEEPLLTLQKVYSSNFAHPAKNFLSHFTKNEGMYLYANDQDYVSGYLEKCYSENKKNNASKNDAFNLLDHLKKPKHHDLAVIVGNGNLLSLIPDFSEKYFILLDQEPAVHFFMLKVREIILNTTVTDDFNEIRAQIISKIKELEYYIYNENHLNREKDGIENEVKSLGDKHFLSSRSRFENCKKALQEKQILPINMDMLNVGEMKKFSKELQKVNCKITFLNITNVPDYDRSEVLSSVIKHLPLAEHYKIISTSLVGYPSKGGRRLAFVSTNESELSEALEYSYYRNRSPVSHPRSFSSLMWP